MSERAEDDLARLRARMRLLMELGETAAESIELDVFLDQAVKHVSRATGIRFTKVLRYREEAGDLLMQAGVGWKEGLVGTATFPVGLEYPSGRAYLTAIPTLIENIDEAEDYRISPVLRDHGVVALANVPILIGRAAWGVLEVDSVRPDALDEDLFDFLRAAAAIAASVIRRTEAVDATRVAIESDAGDSHRATVLLQEMQHRVKNNFQIILSSIALQKQRYRSQETTRALDHILAGVNAIALAHQQLDPSLDMRVVNMSAYLRALCTRIERNIENAVFRMQFADISMVAERAVPLGLIVNELVTNSVKHAFGDECGTITVTLESGIGVGEAQLTVADDGKGLSDSGSEGSGQRLLELLAAQVGGRIEATSTENGTATTVQFPIVV